MMMVLLWIWGVLLFTLFSVVITEEQVVPISQVYGIISTPSPSPSPSEMSETGGEYHHRDSKMKIVITLTAASALLGGLLFFCCLWLFRLKRLKTSAEHDQQSLEVTKGRPLVPILGKLNSLRMGGKRGHVSILEYNILEAATNSFDERNKIGVGGQGHIYKACLGENLVAAVKKLHGRGIEREFQNEIVWLSKLQHQNIVTLLGYCIHEDTRFLVYEMMQNGSLESQLHDPSPGSGLTWSLRMKIALDVARGLEYLHEHCEPAVLHRNIKSSNILLDSNFNAKLSGFSLAVSVGMQNKNDLKVSEAFGYLAPEYLSDGKLTDKGDVYAFGLVLLELLTGRKPVKGTSPAQCQPIVTWAMPQLTDRLKLPNIVDPVIKGKMDPKHLYQVAAVAVLCVQPEPSYRPLITDVLHSLIPLVPVELAGSLRVAETSKH